MISGRTVFETNPTTEKPKKRKKHKNTDASDIDGYLGPWAKYKDEELVSHPSEVSLCGILSTSLLLLGCSLTLRVIFFFK